MATTQRPLNPYIAGRAVGGERGFFGRQDILREVERTLTSPDQNALVLFGQRRIGKTSILLQLERRLPSPPFVPVYFDLMDKARLPLSHMLYELAATAAPLVVISPPSEAEFEGGDDAFRHAFLPAAYGALGGERRLVFLFDEFDVLDVAAEEKLPGTAAARAFFPYLRGLMAGEPRLGFVFVVGRKTDELSTDFLATFKAARYRRVSVLSSEAARELITLAQREGSLNFTGGAVERILALTAGHPYFIQLLCQILFDRAYDAGPKGVPTVDAADVEAVTPDALEAGSQAFEWVWGGLPPAERIIFSAIATHADEATVLTEDKIMAILQDAGIRILIKELALAPRTLVEWEMLEEADGGYRFFVELMRRWVAEQKRLERMKDELDRVIPLADMLYRSGAGFYGAGDVESAIGQLQQTLGINPNHLKARLLLGTICRERGQLEEAVAEFEAAYRYDEVEGRYELVRTLLAYGEALGRQGNEDEALKTYERVLEVSPREQMAQEQQAALWEKRGDRALAENDFEAAIEAYRQARADQKLAQVKAHKLKTELEQAAKEGKAYEEQDEWAKAADVYRRLTELGPDDERWQKALKRIEEELWLAERYAEGAGYVQQEEWDKAQKTLARVINKRPDYQDAAGLLALAVQRGKGQPDPARELRRRLRLVVAGGVGLLLLSVAGVWGYGQIQNKVQAARLTATAIAQATAAQIDAATQVAAAIQGTQLAELRATQTAETALTATVAAIARATQTTESQRTAIAAAIATQTARAPKPTPTSTHTPRPTLTPTPTITPVPASAIVYSKDFEDGVADDWKVYVGTWSVEEDEDGNHFWRGTGPEDYPQAWLNATWTDYALEFRVRFVHGGVFICVRTDGGSQFYVATLSTLGWNHLGIYYDGEYRTLKERDRYLQENRWYKIRVEIQGTQHRLYIDDELFLTNDDSTLTQGGIGFYMGGGGEVEFDDIRVWALTAAAIATQVAQAPTVTPTPIVTIDRFVGVWRNADPNTPGWTVIEITSNGNTLYAHFWGKCHPTDCDAGTISATYEGDPVPMNMDSGFATKNLTLALEGDTLHVTTFTHFTDNSGRADYTREDYFRK